MYTVAAFPQPRYVNMLPSESAKARCREAVRNIAALCQPLAVSETNSLGPMFAFIVWVAARSLVILWTTGHEGAYETKPADLELLMNVLHQMTPIWPGAGHYLDIIQHTLDSWQTTGGSTVLQIFNDTRRTSYGLMLQLGQSARARKLADLDLNEFFDMGFLEEGNPGKSTDAYGFGFTSDWLL